MKAKINKEGQLKIYPENATESYAIVNWIKNNSKGDSYKKGSIRFNLSAHIIKFFKK